MNQKDGHENVARKTAKLLLALDNRIDELRESELPPSEGVEACMRELAYPVAGILSLVEREHRREILKNALDMAQRAASRQVSPTCTRKTSTTLVVIEGGDER